MRPENQRFQRVPDLLLRSVRQLEQDRRGCILFIIEEVQAKSALCSVIVHFLLPGTPTGSLLCLYCASCSIWVFFSRRSRRGLVMLPHRPVSR